MSGAEYRRQCQRQGCTNAIARNKRQARFCTPACKQADFREMKRKPELAVCEHCGNHPKKKRTRKPAKAEL